MTSGPLEDVYSFVEVLNRHGLHFDLHSFSPDCVVVLVSVPGERWEVEFFRSGRRTIERFRSLGAEPASTDAIRQLVTEFGEAS